MTDDIVTRLRDMADRCTHGNERFYNGPEGVETYRKKACQLCGSWKEAADEIERLMAQAERWIVLCERAMAYQSGSDWQDIRISYEIALNDYKTRRISG